MKNKLKQRFLNMESCNFVDFPKGGQTTFAKQIMTAYGEEVALVGITTDSAIPVGKWSKVEINGTVFDYFAVAMVEPSHKKPFIPKRLQMYMAFKKYKKEIYSLGVDNVFIQAPEILLAIDSLPGRSVCVNMPGIVNPIANTRYKGAKYLASLFDYFYINSLKKADVILASADSKTINNFLETRGKIFKANDIIHFPTRVETELFFPIDKQIAREQIKLNNNDNIFVVTGRLAKIKGWKLIIDAFNEYNHFDQNSKLYFVGDGEDRLKIENYVKEKRLEHKVLLVGAVIRDTVALWINASDAILIGSFTEGWSLSMLESVACCKPIITTDISGAKDMIKNGINGYICDERSSKKFSEYMKRALVLDKHEVSQLSLTLTERYTLSHLKEDLDQLWKR